MSSSAGLLCDAANCYDLTLQLGQWLSSLNYSVSAIPLHKNQPLEITALFTLIKIISLDNTGILNTMGIITLFWSDDRLKWNASKYANLTWYETRVGKVWSPTLTLLNPAGTPVNFQITKETIWVNSSGTLSGIINAQFTTACNVDLSLFPYDTQTCHLDFGVIEYWTAILNFKVNSTTVSLDFYLSSQDWDIEKSSLSVKPVYFVDDNYSVLRVTLQLTRDSFYYVVSLVFPVVLLQLLLILVFILPQGSALRVTLAASLVLTMYVLQKDSAKLLPSFDGTKYPQLILGLCAGMILGAVVLLNSVVSVILCQLDLHMPDWLWRALLLPQRKATPASASPSGRHKSDSPQDSLDAIKTRITALRCSSNGADRKDELKQSCPHFESSALVELQLDKLEGKKQALLLQQEKKRTLQAWARLEFVVNLSFTLGYIIAGLYYVIVCMTKL